MTKLLPVTFKNCFIEVTVRLSPLVYIIMESPEMDFGSDVEQEVISEPVRGLDVTEFIKSRQYFKVREILSSQELKLEAISQDYSHWVIENNRLVCEFKLCSSNRQLVIIEEKLNGLLMQLDCVEVTLNSLLLYVVVSFNTISTILFRQFAYQDIDRSKQTVSDLIEKHLQNCFEKTSEFMCSDVLNIGNTGLSDKCIAVLNIMRSGGFSNDLLLLSFILTKACMLFGILNNDGLVVRKLFHAFKSLLHEEHIFLPNTLQPLKLDVELILSDNSSALELSPSAPNCHETLAQSLQCVYRVGSFIAVDYISCLESNSADETSEDMIYLKAFILWKQERWKECLNVCSSIKNRVHRSPHRWLNLIGCCMAVQKQPNTAIQIFNEALGKTGGSVLPLFNIALAYRTLGKPTAELECLKLLTEAFENCLKGSSEPINTHFLMCEVKILSEQNLKCEMSLLHAIYTFAKRSLELGHYMSAVVSYHKLIEILKNGTNHTQYAWFQFKLPSVKTIFRELIYCLLQVGQYKECLRLCDQYLHTTSTNDDSLFQTGIQFKRKFDSLTGLTQNLLSDQRHAAKRPTRALQSSDFGFAIFSDKDEALEHLSVMMFKADALAHMANYSEALATLNVVIANCEESLSVGAPKLDFDGSFNAADTINGTHPLREILRDAMLNKANILFILSRQSGESSADSIAVSSLALQMQSGTASNETPKCSLAMYNHAILLLQVGRWKDACQSWLPLRGVTPDLDTLASILSERVQTMEDTRTNSGTGFKVEDTERCDSPLIENDLLELDVFLLRTLKDKTGG